MNIQHEDGHAECLDDVCALVTARVDADNAAQVERFVRQYYAGIATSDLAERSVDDLYGSALAHWRYAAERKAGETSLHIYNPQVDEHGWQSTHTVVELVLDDMPFLVDSVRMAVNRFASTIHLVVHPVLRVQRDAEGRLVDVLNWTDEQPGAVVEAVMRLEIDRQADLSGCEELHAEVLRAIADVRAAVEDWQPMRQRLQSLVDELRASPPPLEGDSAQEGREFLEWLLDDHFTFLGYREYEMSEEAGETVVHWGPGPGLGIRRTTEVGRRSAAFDALPQAVREASISPELVVVSKANAQSRVHRPGYMDYVGVRRIDSEGVVRGEYRFLGLYTSAAYNRSPRHIPMLAGKVANVLARAGYPPRSHAGKALINILETYPRDVVFQANEDELLQASMEVLHLQERQRIRLFIHPDRFGRFVSCIVFVPRDRFRTEVRLRIQEVLCERMGGAAVDFTVWLSESVLARLYFIIQLDGSKSRTVNREELEDELRQVTRAWTDDLNDAVHGRFGEAEGIRLLHRYGQAFRSDYREAYPARLAVRDIEQMEQLSGSDGDIAMSLYRPLEAGSDVLHFKLFQAENPVPLSDALPVLENMGLRVIEERPSKIKRQGAARVFLHDFGLTHGEGSRLELSDVRENFQNTFAEVWGGRAENDGFNRLVLRAGLACPEIIILRAYCKFLRQTRSPYSQAYMERALAANPNIAQMLVRLFAMRFDPDIDDETRPIQLSEIWGSIEAALDDVANLDEDRILRSFLGVILATVRTNFYQYDDAGRPPAYLALKMDCAAVPDLPEPRPLFEIFVYSPRVEGVHLRGSKVARGGLRWSDRPEDFRTEVLGLVKAQMVKNAVIVPTGSKGGFVPKHMPGGDRDAMLAEGIACYQIFIRALLDITDNLVESVVIPPVRVVRHDDDDPYLVVAADKGTATFSDIANAIAVERGFWLGDAFASGGSEGYDHKGMGITARGGWESVKRHFRQMGVDTQSHAFTVAGIGDMAGDVFGNGMLLSSHIKLIAAFNHMHIFLDPAPEVEATFAERRRLFELPRSSWSDYDTSLISAGGGIFERSAKSVRVSAEVAAVLDVGAGSMAPNDLIRAILKAPVDLLWNGGIGTYVKAEDERNADVGDRANDSLRIDATELRCRVIGEGGNLGFTQAGRIEFALAGGRVNTDAIDNAAGVDCSDHEVNIKILLGQVVANGDMTPKQRNVLLAEMTDEVGELVLRNNYLQTQALSLAGVQAHSMLDVHTRLMRALERDARLDRVIEGLPDAEEIQQRRANERGLVAPELAVVMAYTKIDLYQQLVVSDLPEDASTRIDLDAYFPRPLRTRFADGIQTHQLRREIIATLVANELVNREGMSFVFRLGEETGASTADIARAYMVARDAFDMRSFWADVEALDNLVSAPVQIELLLDARRLQERASRWILRNTSRPINVAQESTRLREGISVLGTELQMLLPSSGAELVQHKAADWVEAGVPEALALRAALMTELYSALDIVSVSGRTDEPVAQVGAVYFGLHERMDLGWLRDQVVALARSNRWQALSRAALRDELYSLEAALTHAVLADSTAESDVTGRIGTWLEANEEPVKRYRQVLNDLMAGPAPDFPMLSVAMREFRAMCPGTR
jgi:glutamate dehydrogenase